MSPSRRFSASPSRFSLAPALPPILGRILHQTKGEVFGQQLCYFRVRTKERFMELHRSNAENIAEFKKKRTRQIMAVGPIILGFIGLLSVENNPTGIFGLAPKTILVAAFAVIISVLVFSLLNWRCPSCNKYLGKAINPKFCSKCGTQLG